jgi:PAS domain S-box-containing protein
VLAGTGWEGGDTGATALGRGEMAGYSFLERCPAIVTDFSSEKRFHRSPLYEAHGVLSGISVPMVAGETAVGVLSILYKAPRGIDTAELWYLNVVANTLAVYVQKERSLQKLEVSERFVTSVLESIGEGVVVVGKDFKILSANKGYLRRVGKGLGEVVGSRCYEISHKIDRPCYENGEICTVKGVFETGRKQSSLHTHYDKDGNAMYVMTNSYPITDASGEVVAAVETLFDVTEKVGLERDLEKRVKELEEFYEMAVGRELKMIELKEEISRLGEELKKCRPE